MALNLDRPDRQRLMRKLRNMSPEQKAVIQTAQVNRMFAREDAAKMRHFMGLAEKKRQFDARLSLDRDYLDLADDERKFRKGQRKTSIALAGAGVLGAGAFGWMDILEKKKQAERYDLMTRRLGMGA